jgi:hypothetical protein
LSPPSHPQRIPVAPTPDKLSHQRRLCCITIASGQARRDPAPPARKEGADTPAERRAARARLQAEYRAARPAECAAANPAAELARAIDAIRS